MTIISFLVIFLQIIVNSPFLLFTFFNVKIRVNISLEYTITSFLTTIHTKNIYLFLHKRFTLFRAAISSFALENKN